MSEFRGFRCEGCGTIVSIEDRVKETVRFTGPEGDEGSYFRDLCRTNCAPKRRAEVEKTYQRTPTRAKRRRREHPHNNPGPGRESVVAAAS